MQLTIDFGTPANQPWQMTLAEYTQSMVGALRPDYNWQGERLPRDVAIDLRGKADAAYVRKEYKWHVIRAWQAGEPVDAVVVNDHPILAALFKEATP